MVSGTETQNDLIFLSDDFGEIDADVRCVDAPARGVSRVVSDLRAVNHRFGRGAADVDAGAAKILSLDQRYRPAEIRQAVGKRIAGLPGTDDDAVVFPAGLPRKITPKLSLRIA